MYAVIERYRVRPEAVDEAVRRIEDVMAGAVRLQIGFVEFDVIRAGAGTVMTVCLFETRDQARRTEDLAHEFEQIAMADLALEPVWELEGEVTVYRPGEEAPA
jgi:heme-degrading monooxygenase HmoA